MVMSDRGLPLSYRHMDGSIAILSADNQRFWLKFHFRSQQGIESLTDHESDVLAG
jgi:catalase